MGDTAENWLKKAAEKLQNAGIASAQLDAELILARALKIERTALHANPQKKISKLKLFHANNWLNRRARRVPLAYIFSEKEFYGRDFFVNQNVLVPRPETETLVEITKRISEQIYAEKAGEKVKILDVGTGSGIIPVTLAAELGEKVAVCASDISLKALSVANLNAKRILGHEIPLFISDLLAKIPSEILQEIEIITANLPYVNREWINFAEANELHHEPQIALYAEDGGIELIKKLIQQTEICPKLKFLVLEADPEQFAEIETFTAKFGFSNSETQNYTITLQK
jgi:release factor glutamine methyltransferase